MSDLLNEFDVAEPEIDHANDSAFDLDIFADNPRRCKDRLDDCEDPDSCSSLPES